MKITWLSNAPYTNSGYGQQTRIFTPRIAALGHHIDVIAYYGLEGGVIQYAEDVMLWPKRFHPYGNDVFIPYTMRLGSHIAMSLMDVWVMNVEEYPQGMRWIPWYPVDHDPMPGLVRQKLNGAFRRIAMSKFGVSATHNAGLDCFYVPHGVETGTLHPRDKAGARKALGLPEDAYIVGTVAMNKGNPSRKNFVEMMTAFANCKRRHADWVYMVQTDPGVGVNDTVNLPELAQTLGLVVGKDVLFPDNFQNFVGFPPPYFQDFYSAIDVHLLTSAGEGFGIPTLEAQACGCPVIVGNWTAMSELCIAGRMIDKKDAEPYYTPLASYQFRPHIGAIEDALEAEWRTPTDTAKAVTYIQGEYDADVVMEKYWKPTLAAIEAAL